MIVEPHRESDGRIRGATRSAPWGMAAVAIVSPLTERVVMLERLFGFRFTKDLHLPGVAPISVAASRDRNALWVGGEHGDLVRLSNDKLQPVELGRVNVGRRIPWIALGASLLDTGYRRDSSARFLNNSSSNERVSQVRSDFMAFVPSATGVRVFNARLDGIVDMGEISGVPSYEAGAFDDATGCLFLASSRGEGAVLRVNPDNSFTPLASLTFPNVQGAIQARVIGSMLHVISESRNRWTTWDVSDPENPVLAADDTYDQTLYWEGNPVRWVDDDGVLYRRQGSLPAFVPADWPVTDGGTADGGLRWALHGEVGAITWDQRRGILPFRVFRSGGLSNTPLKKVGCMPRQEGQINDPTDPDVTIEILGNATNGGATEVSVWDADDTEVFSKMLSQTGIRIPRRTAPVTVSYYDCLEGAQPHQNGRSEQFASDGTDIVRTRFTFRFGTLRARVSATSVPVYTTSTSGFFLNPADPVVAISKYYEDEFGFIVVKLAAAVPVGRVITIQDSSFASGSTELSGFVRQVPPVVHFPVLASGARAPMPAPEAGYGNDESGHTPGTYRFRWKSGSFFDPNTNQYFVFNLDGTSKIRARNAIAQSWTTPDATWAELSATVDAAATEAAAQAIAAAQAPLIVLPEPNQCRLGAFLDSPPAGCTGTVELYVECITPWVPP